MRTTLTLDDDVAAMLGQLRKERSLNLKRAVNEALRRGLTQLLEPPADKRIYRTPGRSLGLCLAEDMHDVSSMLAMAEGEDYK